MKAENYVTLEFLSRSANEGFARMAAASFAAQLDPTLDEIGDIKTAVSEAVTNAIVHAYPDELGKIVMKLRILEGGVLELTVRDWGRGIDDIRQARQPLFTTGGQERSGMGFTIMESFMDRLTVKSTPGKGTTVSMRKRIAPRLSGRRRTAGGGPGGGQPGLRAGAAGKQRTDLEHCAAVLWLWGGDGRPVSAGMHWIYQSCKGV